MRFGRIGTAGQAQTKAFPTADAARREHDKLVAEKTKKGYAEVGGVAPGEPLAAIEKAVGAKLPEALASFLASSKDGSGLRQGLPSGSKYARMSVDEIVSAHRNLTELMEAGDFDQPSHWSPKWVPFLDSGSGDHVCVDLGGSFGGPVGQVVEFWHDETTRNILAPSMEAWLEALATTLKTGAETSPPGYPQSHESSEPAPGGKTKAKEPAPAKAAKPGKGPVSAHPRALPPAGAKAPRKTTLLATLPPRPPKGGGQYEVAFGLDGARYAFVAPVPEKEPNHVVCDGAAGPDFDWVTWPAFSPDGRLAHQSRKGKRQTMYVGDGAFGPYDNVKDLVFSADGTHWAFVAEQDNRALVVHDGKPSELHDKARLLPFSADGRLVTARGDGGAWQVIVGDRMVAEHKAATNVRQAVVSPDGKHVAHVAVGLPTGSKQAVLLDGKVVAKCESVQLLGFSPKGILYWADGLDFVFGDDEHLDDEWVDDVVFDADGKLYARLVQGAGGTEVFAGKKKLAFVPGEFGRAFHPGTRAFAFVEAGKQLTGPKHVVVGDRRHGPFDTVKALSFSADGAEVRFGARQGQELTWNVVAAR